MPTVLDTSTVPGLRPLYYLSVAGMVVSGFFCLTFLTILLYNYGWGLQSVAKPALETVTAGGVPVYSSDPSYRQPAVDSFNGLPTDDPVFLEVKRKLSADKQNAEIQTQVRELDRRLRITYFKRREMIDKTSPLLLVATIIFLTAAWTTRVLKRPIPIPRGEAKIEAALAENRRLGFGTLTLFALGLVLVGLAAGLSILPRSPLEQVLAAKLLEEQDSQPVEPTPKIGETAGETQTTVTPAVAPPAEEPPLDRDAFLSEAGKNWPSFRGFDGSGVVSAVATTIEPAPVTKWDAVSGENIVWKTEVPLPGKSSPVVWGDKIFLTGADEVGTKRQIFCFHAADGKLLWTADAPSTPASQAAMEYNEDTGFAAPTMVLDGRRAFALFANGDLAAVDFDGKVIWSKSLGIPDSSYGFASSLALYFDRLIVQYDVGDGTDGKSKLLAFDTKTGDVIWETPREIPNSWSSPTVKKIADRDQIITFGDPFVIAYDPEDGKELWRVKALNGDVGPSPAAWGNIVYVANASPRTSAIDVSVALASGGDVTASAILWQGTNALPDTVSPFATQDKLYTLDSYGYMTCYDPTKLDERKRAAFWELEIGGGTSEFYSSPLLVGNLVYVFSKNDEEAKAFVIDLSKAATDDEGKLTEEAQAAMIVAENPMGEPCVASPAPVAGKIYVRGTTTLFCIGEK